MPALRTFARGCAFVLLAAPAAWAQTLDAGVESLVREGIAHRIAGRDEAAIVSLEAAYAAQRAPVTAGQLALAYQAVGRWVEADRFMREALAAPDDDWVRRHRRDLDEAHAIVRRNVGELELRGGPAGARVSVDGVTLGRLPLDAPLRLRAGVVTVEVRAEGYFPFTRQVAILGGELTREPVTPTPLPRQVPSAQPSPTEVAVRVVPPGPARASVLRVPTATWVLAGVGASLLVGGGVSLVLRESSARRFNEECPRLDSVPRDAQTGSCRGELAVGDWTKATTVVGFSGGAVLGGVGILLAVLPSRESSAPLALRCAPTFAGASCALSF